MTGEERVHAGNKSSKSRPFFDLLNNKFDRAVKFFLTKRGYTFILSMNQLIGCCACNIKFNATVRLKWAPV